MQRLEILLVYLLDWHKLHGGPCHGLTDGFGIGWIILIRFHIGLDELRRNEFHRMAMFAKTACPIMRATSVRLFASTQRLLSAQQNVSKNL